MKRLVAPVFAGVLLVLPAAGAQGAQGADPCLPSGVTVLQDSGKTVLYRRDEGVYGCVRSVGEHKLVTAIGGDDQVTATAVAGGYGAVATMWCSRYDYECEAGSLHIVRLNRPGRRRIVLDDRRQRK